MLDDHRLKIKEGLKRQMKKRVLDRQCPKCYRKDACKRYVLDPWLTIRKCRWCDYEKAYHTNL